MRDEADDAQLEAVDVDALIEESGEALSVRQEAARFGLNDSQLKAAMALLRGEQQSAAALVAGYGGKAPSPDADRQTIDKYQARLRSAGSKVANSPRVVKFLAAMRQSDAAKPVEEMNANEKRSVLAKIARNSTDAIKVRAVLGLQQIEREERERAEDKLGSGDPVQTLVEIASLSPACLVVARGLAARENLTEAFERAWLKHTTAQSVAGNVDGEAKPFLRSPAHGTDQLTIEANHD